MRLLRQILKQAEKEFSGTDEIEFSIASGNSSLTEITVKFKAWQARISVTKIVVIFIIADTKMVEAWFFCVSITTPR